jgi:type IV pilus assembly protein PilX
MKPIFPKKQSARSPSLQGGAALIVSLLFLLVMTVIGVTGLQTTALEEKITGNMRDRSLAFEAAESALAAGEALLSPAVPLPTFSADGTNGFYSGPIPDRETVWSTPGQVHAYSDGALAKVGHPPAFTIEVLQFTTSITVEDGSLELGPMLENARQAWFRVTARGTGGSDSSVVMLQSIYRR